MLQAPKVNAAHINSKCCFFISDVVSNRFRKVGKKEKRGKENFKRGKGIRQKAKGIRGLVLHLAGAEID